MDRKVVTGKFTGLEVAIIGMAGRFPDASNILEFWSNLKKGVESISFFDDEELMEMGIDPMLIQDPNYVKAKGVMENIEYFDAFFFDYSKEEAELMDPQIRIFHECVWEALEDSGYTPGAYNGLIGLYGGASVHNEWLWQTANYQVTNLHAQVSPVLLTDKDFLTTRISYKLNLKGPSSTMFSACSTSLIAVHQACQGLLSGECRLALAGGVSITTPKKNGYLFQEGMIRSRDGHCRAYDAAANGTVFGNGTGIVVLKQLEESIHDRDHIYAIIKGSAINNDGRQKVGYAAPSIKGQAAVIRTAHHISGVEPESIGYIEGHGSGTTMGDPIEMEALKQAFNTNKRSYCRIGSVKTNIGHLDAAAGVVGLIKTVLILKHRLIPPSLNFEMPNPEIDFDNSPFYVNRELTEWESHGQPLRAAVSSFGIGGSNAHVIMEEYPEVADQKKSRDYQLILLSAKSESSLDKMTENMAEYLDNEPEVEMDDIAYTLQEGRSAFDFRRIVVCQGMEDALKKLSSPLSLKTHQLKSRKSHRAIVFMFPGQGAQYINMGKGLYQAEPVFRVMVDYCLDMIEPYFEINMKELLFPSENKLSEQAEKEMSRQITQTEIAQPLLFIFEYALAKLLMSWGVEPEFMIGHSIGEYTAACLSGVFSLDDALELVVLRGMLMKKIPKGSMLSITVSEEELIPLLDSRVSLAAVNSPRNCVISGTSEVIAEFEEKFKELGYQIRILHTSHAFHSHMMDPVLEQFRSKLEKVELNKPGVPFISNVTGEWITEEQALSPDYWTTHLRQGVLFFRGMEQLLKIENSIFLEVGPGRALSTFASQCSSGKSSGINPKKPIINLVRHPQEKVSDQYFLLEKIGECWLYGKDIDWDSFYKEKRSRVPLPYYPFEKKRFWAVFDTPTATEEFGTERQNLEDWFYIPSWKRTDKPGKQQVDFSKYPLWVVFEDQSGLGGEVETYLKELSLEVKKVRIGSHFQKAEDGVYSINPAKEADFVSLFQALALPDTEPVGILYLWNLDSNPNLDPDYQKSLKLEEIDTVLDKAYYGPLNIVRSLEKNNFSGHLRLVVMSNHIQEVIGGDLLCPVQATILGPLNIIQREYPHYQCVSLDVGDLKKGDMKKGDRQEKDEVFLEIFGLKGDRQEKYVAYRRGYRWIQDFEPISLPIDMDEKRIPGTREGGVYLITGGLGGIGLVLAQQLALSSKSRLVLIGRSAFPEKADWDTWIQKHGVEDSTSIKIHQVRELEKLGSEVRVFSQDITDLEGMTQLIQKVTETFGPVNGVIHSAGIPDGALIRLRNRQLTEKILAPKIKGTWVLHQILDTQHLDFFILCSSILSIWSQLGQVGYTAANSFLDAFAYYKSWKDKVRTLSVGWDIWREVGMAANLNAPRTQFQEIQHYLYGKYKKIDDNLSIYVAYFRVSRFWFLDEHRVRGSAILLGTVYLEMARSAFEKHVGHSKIEMRNFYFLNPLMVGEEEEVEMQVLLQKRDKGYEFFFASRLNYGQNQWKPHARGEISELDSLKLTPYHIEEIESQCQASKVIIADEEHKPYDSSMIDVGRRWDSLIEVKLGKYRGLGLFQLPEEYADDLKSYKLHPALIDFATSYLVMVDKRIRRGGYLPFSYKSIKIFEPIPQRFLCYSRYLEDEKQEKDILTFDVKLMDEKGNPIVEIEGFQLLTVMDEGKEIAEKVREKFSITPYMKFLENSKSANNKDYLDDPLNSGISTAEGIEVFKRVMNASSPHVVISTQDLDQLLLKEYEIEEQEQENDTASEPEATDSSKLRQDLSTSYVAPRDEMEEILVQILKEHLKLDRVGVFDNFFELGATSLDITSLTGIMEEKIKRNVPLVAMFSYPTINDLKIYLSQDKKDTEFSTEEIERLEKKSDKPKDRLKQRKTKLKGKTQ
jgi:acyl transferase domain-containing protein/acyl carrier protein